MRGCMPTEEGWGAWNRYAATHTASRRATFVKRHGCCWGARGASQGEGGGVVQLYCYGGCRRGGGLAPRDSGQPGCNLGVLLYYGNTVSKMQAYPFVHRARGVRQKKKKKKNLFKL